MEGSNRRPKSSEPRGPAGLFDPYDKTQMDALTSVALKQVARSAGRDGYAALPLRGSPEHDDLEQEMRLAAVEAARTDPSAEKTRWQTALDAAVNAGRRSLYGADREIPASALESVDSGADDSDAPPSAFDHAQEQPWEEPGGPSSADIDRRYAEEERPALPPEWDTLRRWVEYPAMYGVQLDAVKRTIIANWGMDANRLAALTGLSSSNVRQRKHRLLDEARAYLADLRAKYA